jgi:hypothetical protein
MGYEFNSEENYIFEKAAGWMRIVAIAVGLWGCSPRCLR